MFDWCAPSLGQRIGRNMETETYALIDKLFDYKDIKTAKLEEARADGRKQHLIIPPPKIMLKILKKQLPKATDAQKPYLEQVKAVAENFA